jgi:hypothetical protein
MQSFLDKLLVGVLGSWKTTLGWLIIGLGMILTQAGYSFDADPLTNPSWEIIGAGAIIIWNGIWTKDTTKTGVTKDS